MDGMKCPRCGANGLEHEGYFFCGTKLPTDTPGFQSNRCMEQENARLRAIVEPLERMLAAGRTIGLGRVGRLCYVARWNESDDASGFSHCKEPTLAEALAKAAAELEVTG